MKDNKENLKRKRCFVIMPFSKTTEERSENYWTNHFVHFLKPLIEETGEIEAKRSSALREDLISSIISQLLTVPVVVADLTDYNPNVLWELGVRQSFKSGTITIAEEGTKIPFNLSTKGTLFYTPNDSSLTNQKFNKSFQKALVDCIKNPISNDSRILEIISGRGSLYEIIKYGENKRKLEALLTETKYNLQILNRYLESDKRNIESLDAMDSLRDECIKLIITERYLDLSNDQFKLFYPYYNEVKSFNNMFESIRLGKHKFILRKRFGKSIGKDGLIEMQTSFSMFYYYLMSIYQELKDRELEMIHP